MGDLIGEQIDSTAMSSNNDTNKSHQEVVLLDGGFGSQLELHVQKRIDGDVLWSSRYLLSNPEAVVKTHLDFLRAGATIIGTNTYQASLPGFEKHLNLTEKESFDLIKHAVDLAKEACSIYAKENPEAKPRIVGSIGPFGAFLNDGSEYTGAYIDSTSMDTMIKWHRPRINALVEAGIDLFALETIPCKLEAEMLVELIKEYPGVKAWLSFSCIDNGLTAHGENFQEVARKCYDMNPEQLIAVGANCIAPKIVEELFTNFNAGREDNPIPLIVYPNSGEDYAENGWVGKETVETVDPYVQNWLDLGVRYIGGCCRMYAEDIVKIGSEIRKWQNKQQINGNASN